jgi:hypothetical protein
MNMATDPNLGFLDAILYLEPLPLLGAIVNWK